VTWRVAEEPAEAAAAGGDVSVVLEVAQGGAPAARISATWRAHATRAQGDGTPPPGVPAGAPPRRGPADLGPDDLPGANGTLALVLDVPAATRLFPEVAARLPPGHIADLLATTRLVGMECPGLHSVYSELDLTFGAGDAAGDPDPPELAWEVTRFDARVSLVLLSVRGVAASGTLKAFLRPAPRSQPTFAELRARVAPDAFAGERALVVGGSRGLGEVAAKVLAAGGADVRVTYVTGQEDARRVADQIREGGGAADALSLDALDPAPALERLRAGGWAPTHLSYFATPFIGGGVRGGFDMGRFRRFCDFYVEGLQRVVTPLLDGGLTRLFYPSSVFAEDPPVDMGEYAAAKRAGEGLCAMLSRAHPALRVHAPRLPRLPTDQTVSLLPRKDPDPVDVVLEHLEVLAGM
jgi:hypothetical protein